jgi:hypothetical protein
VVEPEIVASEGEDVRHGHGSERKRRRLGIDQARHGTEGADSPSRAQPAGEFMTSTLSWPLRLSIRTDITLTCYKVRLSNMAYNHIRTHVCADSSPNTLQLGACTESK